MQAFAEGSLNNAIGGSGPVNKGLDFDRIHGRGAEGFDDYNSRPIAGAGDQFALPKRPAPDMRRDRVPPQYRRQPQDGRAPPPPADAYAESMQIDDPKGPVLTHGEESLGLGTSTFLEGAPVPRSVLQRQTSNTDTQAQSSGGGGGGLQRKKSLAQKIRGMSRTKHDGMTSPEPRYVNAESGTPMSPTSPHSTGGTAKLQEMDPFFPDGTKTVEPLVEVREADEMQFSTIQRTRTASSPPRRGIMRRMTNETSPPAAEVKAGGSGGGGGGLLNRVKSLKGGRRAKPDVKPYV